MYKDQIYLRGAIEILTKRKKIDFLALHAGKISLNDYFIYDKFRLINIRKYKKI